MNPNQPSSTSPEDTTKTTATQGFDTRIGILKARLKVAEAFSKKPHDQWRKFMDEYEIKDLEDVKQIRDNIRIPTVFRQVESDLPAVFDDQPDLFIKGRGKWRQFDPIFDNTYDWLWDTQNMEGVIEDAGSLFLLTGMAFVESPWVTKTKTVQDPNGAVNLDGTPVVYEVPEIDNPQAETGDPFKYHFSPETKFSLNLDYKNCPYYFKEHSMTADAIMDKFGVEIDPSGVLHTENNDVDFEVEALKDAPKDDMKRETVYEYYGCLPKEMVADIQGDTWSYDKDYHLWFTMEKELQAEECRYSTKPLKILGNYGLITKFWKFGDAKHLLPLVQELQQYRVQILKHTRRMANPKPMLPNEADIDEAAFEDPNVGRVVKYTATGGFEPKYMQPAALGSEVSAGIELVRTDIEQTKGSFSLAQGTNQSQVRSPRGIQTFSEAADRNVNRKKKKIARFIKELMIFQFKECSNNWKPDDPRTVDILTGGLDELQQMVPEGLQMLGDTNILARIDIEIESLSVNKVQMKQDALDLLDIALKSEAEIPGYLNMEEIWKDVLQNAFNKKDGDRYMITPEQRQQMQQAKEQAAAQAGQKGPSESIAYKDLPPEGQLQLAAQAGIHLDPVSIARVDHLAQAKDQQASQMKAQAIAAKPNINPAQG